MTDVVVAVDIGGTGIKCALVDLSGPGGRDPVSDSAVAQPGQINQLIRYAERHPTGAERGPDAVVATILDVITGLVARARALGLTPRAVGLVAPGVIDAATGTAVWAANVGFRDVPLRDLVVDRCGLRTVLGHDVRAGALAEARLGAGRGAERSWFVAIGTGIAAAYVVRGGTDPGAHGASGEIGHVVVRPDGPPCGCGGRGCVEAVASASSVARRYRERTGVSASARDVVARVSAGEPEAAAIWNETIDVLADGLRIGVTLYDPEVIVIGGGLAEAGDALLTPLGAALESRLTFQTMPSLVRAALGDEAGLIGAALLAHDLAAPA